jgi:hypothetical protein
MSDPAKSERDVTMDEMKSQVRAIQLQVEQASGHLSDTVKPLETLLDQLYEQNRLAHEIAIKNTVSTGQPLEDIKSLEKTIAERRLTLDNLYTLDEKLKVLDKEVEKVKQVQLQLNIAKPLQLDQERLNTHTTEINLLLERVDAMALEMKKQNYKSITLGNISSNAQEPKLYAKALNDTHEKFYAVMEQVKQARLQTKVVEQHKDVAAEKADNQVEIKRNSRP